MAVKLYNNRFWLYQKYTADGWSVDEIAEYCNVTRQTIYAKIREFDL